MSAPAWTPGPWLLPHFATPDHSCHCHWVLAEPYMGSICTVDIDNGKPLSEGGNDCPPLEVAQANARLIAAAPDLYEALAALQLQALQSPDLLKTEWGMEALDKTSAALAKAGAA